MQGNRTQGANPTNENNIKNGSYSFTVRGALRQKRRLIYTILYKIGICFMYAVMGYLLSTLILPFNTRPLGVAALAASFSGLPFILIGALLGAAVSAQNPIIYVCSYGAVVLIRLFLKIMSEQPQLSSEGGAPGEISAENEDSVSAGGLFDDRLFSRMLSALLVSFVIGIYTLIAGGFRYYDLFGAFFSIGAACVATLLLSLCLDGSLIKSLTQKKTRISSLLPAASRALRLMLAFGLIYSARSINIAWFSASAFLAFFITLYICKAQSTLKSAFCGLILGAACGIGIAPLFLLAGAIGSMLYKISPFSAIISAGMCGCVWGTYINGTQLLIFLAPSMFTAGAALLLWDRIELRLSQTGGATSDKRDGRDAGTTEASDAAAGKRLADNTRQLRAMSGAFSDLSEMFYNLSDKLRRPGMLDLRRMCDGAFDIYCPGCPDREMCWGLEYSSTLEVMNELTKRLHTHGRVELSGLPEYLRERCANTENIISEINRSCARMTEAALKSEKTEVFALDYEGMARILCDTLDTDDEEYNNNSELSAAVSGYLASCGLGKATVVCFGGRRKQIIARGMGSLRAALYSEQLREDIEKLSGYQLVGPMFERGDDYTPPSMVFTAKPKIRVECTCRTIAAGDGEERAQAHSFDLKIPTEDDLYRAENKKGKEKAGEGNSAEGNSAEGNSAEGNSAEGSSAEFDKFFTSETGPGEDATKKSPCGDTVNIFLSRKDYLYALISDGMGTGPDAAFTSELCSVFLEKMLSAGNSVETTLRMLNGLVRSKSSVSYSAECSATVDLLELDLLTGCASFIKSGAAQSYIIRDGNVYRLLSKTVPIGIIRAIDAQRLKFDVKGDDIIIMTSDGITQGSEDCLWLTELLSAECRAGGSAGISFEELADKIIRNSRKAARLMGYEKYDDASVIIISVRDD